MEQINVSSPGVKPVNNWLQRVIKSYIQWNNCWNIDAHLRYAVARKALLDIKPESICEVGSGNAGLGQLVRSKVIGFDIAFDATALKHWNCYLNPIAASMYRLPLRSDSFDAMLALDCLEHIPRPHRQAAIVEFMRVAKRRLIFSVPSGAASRASDQQLYERYQQHWKTPCMWLKEHIDLGIPEVPEVIDIIYEAGRQTGKNVEIAVEGAMPLPLHNFNHRMLMTANYRLARPISYLLWILYPFLRMIKPSKFYRHFFIVQLFDCEQPDAKHVP